MFGIPLADKWNFNGSNPCLHVGGNYNHNDNYGLFYVNYNNANNANANIGCPTLYLLSWHPSILAPKTAHLLVKISYQDTA